MRVILAVLFLVVALPINMAQASDPVWYSCSSINSVTGESEAKPDMRVGMLSDFDGHGYLLIQGQLEVPSGGYKYQFSNIGQHGGVFRGTIKLVPPNGMAISMISMVAINERLRNDNGLEGVSLKIDKSFNWGPEQINCEVN